MSDKKKIMIVAGEASGDLHGAEVIKAAQTYAPELEFYGMGGEKMRSAGANIIIDSAKMAVVGIVEVLLNLRTLYSALWQLEESLKEHKPDLLLLIDYPEFNFKLAKTAKKLDIKVLFYVSPQIWAWRSGRVKKISNLVDHMAVIFPFEVEFYQKAGIPVTYVGHPLLDHQPPTKPLTKPVENKRKHQDNDSGSGYGTVGLFPGSRNSELARLLPLMLESAELLHQGSQHYNFILPIAKGMEQQQVYAKLDQLNPNLNIEITDSETAIEKADIIVAASGTVNLEIALANKPLIVVYKVAPLTWQILSRMVKLPYISLVNIVAGKQIVPELLQTEASPQNIVNKLVEILDDKDKIATMTLELQQVKKKLGDGGAAKKVVGLICDLL